MVDIDSRLVIECHEMDEHANDFARDVLQGLASTPKRIPSVYFYDERGSELFEQICELPEYYITRTEKSILEQYAPEIVTCSSGEWALVEFGSGSSFKTRLLIEALLEAQGHLHYFPVDISASMLTESARDLLRDYEKLSITGQVAEYYHGIELIGQKDLERKLVIFLGSNIGNFEPGQALSFLRAIRGILNPNDLFLLGTDLEKDSRVLEAAYNDRDGVTAEFNLNLLHRINRELGGHFRVDQFDHQAFYNQTEGRIEMHLRSKKSQQVLIEKAGVTVHFDPGETIHTENSYKYTLEKLKRMCSQTGFQLQRQWQDPRGYFSLNLLAPI